MCARLGGHPVSAEGEWEGQAEVDPGAGFTRSPRGDLSDPRGQDRCPSLSQAQAAWAIAVSSMCPLEHVAVEGGPVSVSLWPAPCCRPAVSLSTEEGSELGT